MAKLKEPPKKEERIMPNDVNLEVLRNYAFESGRVSLARV